MCIFGYYCDLAMHEPEIPLSLLELHVQLCDVVVLSGQSHVELRDGLFQRAALPSPRRLHRVSAAAAAVVAPEPVGGPDNKSEHTK